MYSWVLFLARQLHHAQLREKKTIPGQIAGFSFTRSSSNSLVNKSPSYTVLFVHSTHSRSPDASPRSLELPSDEEGRLRGQQRVEVVPLEDDEAAVGRGVLGRDGGRGGRGRRRAGLALQVGDRHGGREGALFGQAEAGISFSFFLKTFGNVQCSSMQKSALGDLISKLNWSKSGGKRMEIVFH